MCIILFHLIDLDRLQNRQRDHQVMQTNRRSVSIGNLRGQQDPLVGGSYYDEDIENNLLTRTRSMSSSRKVPKSKQRRQRPVESPPPLPSAPPPSQSNYYAEGSSPVQIHRGTYMQDLNHDADEPDLQYDDPRYGGISRSHLSRVATSDLPRPMYGDQRCMSLRMVNRDSTARALKGTKSASHSRTSLRSLKRRAPQPPGHNHLQPPGHNHLQPENIRADSDYAGALLNNNNRNISSQNSKKNAKPIKHRYNNPYAWRPPVKPKPKLAKGNGVAYSGHTSCAAAAVSSENFGSSSRNRYSDDGSMDESEHETEGAQPLPIFGDNAMDTMDEDVW